MKPTKEEMLEWYEKEVGTVPSKGKKDQQIFGAIYDLIRKSTEWSERLQEIAREIRDFGKEGK